VLTTLGAAVTPAVDLWDPLSIMFLIGAATTSVRRAIRVRHVQIEGIERIFALGDLERHDGSCATRLGHVLDSWILRARLVVAR
jgi:hypothetical protein